MPYGHGGLTDWRMKTTETTESVNHLDRRIQCVEDQYTNIFLKIYCKYMILRVHGIQFHVYVCCELCSCG